MELLKRKFTNIKTSKVNKKAKILFFCMIFVAGSVFSQTIRQIEAPILLFKKPVKPIPATLLIRNSILPEAAPVPFLSANYYAAHLGFFCKQEIKFEKVVKVPFKFRLGSVEDCDRLEGKGKN